MFEACADTIDPIALLAVFRIPVRGEFPFRRQFRVEFSDHLIELFEKRGVKIANETCVAAGTAEKHFHANALDDVDEFDGIEIRHDVLLSI
jgi:hypothetical protein